MSPALRTSPYLREILELDPERDAQRIAYLDTVYEFPFDTTRALEFALFRTFGSPAISSLLDATGEFAQRAQRRYDDTDLILTTIVESGYDSEAGRRALAIASRDMFLAWFPGVPKRFGAHAIAALMDDRLREALGFPRPPRALVRAVEGGLRGRGRAVRMLPPRRRPKLRTKLRHRTYPSGYRIEALGPPPPDAAQT